MFQFQFFGGLARQRKALLASTAQAPIELSPELLRTLDNLENPDESVFTPPKTRLGVMWIGVVAVKSILLRSVLWRIVSSLVVLAGIMLSIRIVRPDQKFYLAVLFGAGFFLSKCIDGVIDYFDSLRRAQINRAVQSELMRLVNRRLADVDPDGLRSFTKGELKTLVSSDVEAIEDFITAAVQVLMPTIVIMLTLGPAIVWMSGAPGAVALSAAVMCIPLSVVAARGMEFFQLRAQGQQDKLASTIGEWIRNIRLVRFLGWNEHFLKMSDGIMRRFTLFVGGRHALACLLYGITTSWWMVPILSMLAFAHYTGRELSLIQLFSSVWMLDHLVQYLTHINHALSMYGSAIASAERLRRLWQTPSLSRLLTGPDFPISSGPSGAQRPVTVALENVSLRIDNKELISDISVQLDLTKRTAIVGAVGSGKTLLLEMVVGERPPSSGAILIEFADLHDKRSEKASLWSKQVYDTYRKGIAYAAQQPYLSNALLRNNIDLSANASDEALEAVRAAAQRAQLDVDIASFARGLEEEVGETGINLSGGQKQRVSLARAFLSNRPVLLLDDPLSAVDADTEQELMREIMRSKSGLVLVSHRLNELKHCDRVLVMEGGKIVEDGSPDVLADRPDSRFSLLLAAGELT